MRLLITTQALDLDDPILGFFHRWIEEFSRHCESVEVICLREGKHDLPENVRVHSLGKEHGAGRITRLMRFFSLIWRLRGRYDSVFVHMNPEYVVLGGALWRAWGKRIGLWYVHKSVTPQLRIAAFFADSIFTAAPGSIGLRSKKIHVVGHGIDVAAFSAFPLKQIDTTSPQLVAVGRITRIKRLETVIEGLALLRDRGMGARLDIIGAPTVAEDHAYAEELRVLVGKRGLESQVTFRAVLPNNAMPQELSHYDIAVNAAPTGGIDKVVLEAMAAGIPVFVCNEAFKEYLAELSSALFFRSKDPTDMASHIEELLKRSDIANLQERLRELARERADVTRLIPRILEILSV